MDVDSPQIKRFNPIPVIIIFIGLAVVVVVFLLLRNLAAGKATDNQAIEQAKQAGIQEGRAEQKKEDEAEFEKRLQNPFRSYKAPGIYGGFEVKVPKNWSIQVVESESGTTQVDLKAHPDLVRELTGDQNNYGLHLQLIRRQADDIAKAYDQRVKSNKATAGTATVAGIKSRRYEGEYDNRKNGSIVLVPVRDKTLVLANEDEAYKAEFEQILAQMLITP